MGPIESNARKEGFMPGGMSPHNMTLARGSDAGGQRGASTAGLGQQKLDDTIAFMFEARSAAATETRQDNYIGCRSRPGRYFDGTPKDDRS